MTSFLWNHLYIILVFPIHCVVFRWDREGWGMCDSTGVRHVKRGFSFCPLDFILSNEVLMFDGCVAGWMYRSDPAHSWYLLGGKIQKCEKAENLYTFISESQCSMHTVNYYKTQLVIMWGRMQLILYPLRV